MNNGNSVTERWLAFKGINFKDINSKDINFKGMGFKDRSIESTRLAGARGDQIYTSCTLEQSVANYAVDNAAPLTCFVDRPCTAHAQVDSGTTA